MQQRSALRGRKAEWARRCEQDTHWLPPCPVTVTAYQPAAAHGRRRRRHGRGPARGAHEMATPSPRTGGGGGHAYSRLTGPPATSATTGGVRHDRDDRDDDHNERGNHQDAAAAVGQSWGAIRSRSSKAIVGAGTRPSAHCWRMARSTAAVTRMSSLRISHREQS
jgi:hypothetical protein